nr:hypothetical protein [Anaerolineae bacterium]
MRTWQQGINIIGLGLLVIGGWYVLSRIAPELPGFARLWPMLFLMAGLAILVQPPNGIRTFAGAAWIGVLMLLTGLFLSVFSLGFADLTWTDTRELWPVFLIIVGISFYAVFVRGGKIGAPFNIVSILFCGAGAILLPLSFGVLHGTWIQQAWQMAPVLLPVLIGIYVSIGHIIRFSTSSDNGL